VFLSKNEILRHLPSLIGDYDEKLVNEVCYDLRVGDEVYRSEEHLPEILSNASPWAILHPGQFALIKTFEIVKVPEDKVALISIRFGFKLQGLVNVSGFHVDPGFRGNLIFAVQNVGPNDIRLRYGEPTFMIMWACLHEPYVPSIGAPKRQGYPKIPAGFMAQLGGGTVTLSQLKTDVDKLHTQVRFFAGLAIALIMALIGVMLHAALPR
jgi:dCTP deaminase